MSDDFFTNIEIDDTGFNKELDNYMAILTGTVVLQVAETLRALILEQIDERLFDTIYGNMVHGIVDFGQYKESWKIVPVNSKHIKVQSQDRKAMSLEWGSTPEDNADLKLSDILSWAERKNVPETLARDIYQVIKYEKGTVPKPAVRRSLDIIISQSDIIERTVTEKMIVPQV